MYEIEFYETEDGKCPIWDFLEALRLKAPTNKDARIQHKQASLYICLLYTSWMLVPLVFATAVTRSV